jgi:calcineurin-like phosphoesterase family protein
MSRIFLTSDTHFGHENIIKYCKRPFANAKQMDDALIANWNEVVGPEDVVWHLGDFALCDDWRKREILCSLNGVKKLILGNHDFYPKSRYGPKFKWDVPLAIADYTALGFDEVFEENTVELRGYKLTHYPKEDKGKYVCGHVHEVWSVQDNRPHGAYNINAGTDVHGFKPVLLNELLTN